MMKPAEETGWQVLVPFDAQEGTALKKAAGLAGKKETTIRNWCVEHGIGRRVGGGVWVVSKVALAMFLDGDDLALCAYRSGDRSNQIVLRYFDRLGIPSRPHPA
jgi:hypothetical protein